MPLQELLGVFMILKLQNSEDVMILVFSHTANFRFSFWEKTQKESILTQFKVILTRPNCKTSGFAENLIDIFSSHFKYILFQIKEKMLCFEK